MRFGHNLLYMVRAKRQIKQFAKPSRSRPRHARVCVDRANLYHWILLGVGSVNKWYIFVILGQWSRIIWYSTSSARPHMRYMNQVQSLSWPQCCAYAKSKENISSAHENASLLTITRVFWFSLKLQEHCFPFGNMGSVKFPSHTTKCMM